MNLYFKLLNIPVFSVSDVNKYYDNIGSARSAVRRLLKAGMIKKIRNDMYTCVDGDNGGVVAERFQIGSSINEDSYISHHTAMEYYGITDQVYYVVYVTSSKRFTDFEFGEYRYRHIYPSIELGIEKQEYSGGVVVTDKERTVLDSIKDMDKISGIEEVVSNVDSIGRLRENKLIKYLEQYDNQFLYQKTGYLLNNGFDKHGLSESFFEVCKGHIGKSKRYMTKDKTKGVYESMWQLIVPLNIASMKNGELLDANI